MLLLRTLAVMLVFFLSGVGTQAVAQSNIPPPAAVPSPAPAPRSGKIDTGSLMKVLTDSINAIMDKASAQSQKLKELGKKTAYSLIALAISFYIISSLLEGGDLFSQIHNGIRAAVYFGIVNLILTNYGSGGIWDVSLWADATQSTIVGELMSGSDGASFSDKHGAMFASLTEIFKVMSRMWAFLEKTVHPEGVGILDMVGVLLALLPTILMLIGTIFVLILCSLMLAAVYMVAQIMLAIGVTFGPIFLAFMIVPQTGFIASGWISYMITCTINLILVQYMIYLVGPGLRVMVEAMRVENTMDYVSVFTVACALFITSAIIFYLVMKVESIASGLISGNGAMGFSARHAFGGMAGAGKAVSGAGKAASSAAGSAAKGAGSAVQGAKAGATAAASAGRSVATGVGQAVGTANSLGTRGALNQMKDSAMTRAKSAISSAVSGASSAVSGAASKAKDVGGIRSAFNQARTAAYQQNMYSSRY